MFKILIVSHSPNSTTGYGRVVRGLAGSLKASGHEIVCLGAGTKASGASLPYPVMSWNGMAAKGIAATMMSQRPDVLLTIGDPWMYEGVPAMAEREAAVWLAYYPVDGYPLPASWKRWAQAVDVPVVFSKFARDVVLAATGKAPALIYHGVNTASFCPDDPQKAKELAKVAGHFVVGTVARNQMRKNIPALVKAFAKFSHDKADALLYLHTQLKGDFDIAELVRHHRITDKTRITGEIGPDKGVPDQLLATVYRALDVFVLPTMAEGFGLPIIESQACGTPALVTDFSACPELVPDPIQRLKVKETLTMARNFEQAIVDVDDIVEKLELLYRDRDRLKSLGEQCHRFARTFDWAVAYKQFNDLLASPQFQYMAEMRRNKAARNGVAKFAVPFSDKRLGAETDRQNGHRTGDGCGRGKPAKLMRAGAAGVSGSFDDVDTLHVSAVEKMTSGESAEAVSLLRRVVELRPSNPDYRNQLAVALQTCHRLAEAIEQYRASLELRPGRHQVWTNLARALLMADDLTVARDAAIKALRLEPKSAPAHDVNGSILQRDGDIAGAKRAFLKAIELSPDFAPAQVHLAELSQVAGNNAGSDFLVSVTGSSTELNEANALEAVDAAVSAIKPYPGGHQDRGIVIVGGGTRYFPCAWVCLRMLRECGCTLPIELWHIGPEEMTPHMRGLVAQYGVECVDGKEKALQIGWMTLGGWELKPFAIMESRFKEVIFLDADNFPLFDPAFLLDTREYLDHGAIFWPDYGKLGSAEKVWDLTGVPFRDERSFESGQFVVDKARCWEPLCLTMWFNRNSRFWYRYFMGDKHTFHLAWRKLGRLYSMPERGIENLSHAMAQHDFAGRRIFQHRNRAKWVMSGWNPRIEGFEKEDRGFAFLDELRPLWQATAPSFNNGAAKRLQRAWKHYADTGQEKPELLSSTVGAARKWMWVGSVASRTENYIPDSHTVRAIKSAIQELPMLAELHAVLGEALGALGRIPEAIEAFRTADRLCSQLPGLAENMELAGIKVSTRRPDGGTDL